MKEATVEWVETTAKTIEEAKDLALDKIGVDTTEAEFEVLEEPRQGLFGRTRGQARVRARVAPKTPRAKEERGRRRRKSGSSGGGSGGGNKKSGGNKKRDDGRDRDANQSASNEDQGRGRQDGGRNNGGRQDNKQKSNRGGSGDRPRRGNNMRTDAPESSLEEVQACVSGFLTGLTGAFGFDDAPVVIDTSNDEVYAQIEGKHGLLLGPKARTLDAIQELTRITAQRTAPSSIRIKVDVGGYREQRGVALAQFAEKAAAKAIDEQVEVVLEPMSPPDRKIVHDALNDVDGVSTRSAGADPRRRVIVVPDDTAADADSGDSDAEDVAEVEETDADDGADAD